MTLIAVFSINGIPVMISDILLSSNKEWRLQVKEIPTIGKLPFLVGKNNDKEFTGLVQKTTLLQNKGIVGWAGNLHDSLDLIEEIEQEYVGEWNFSKIYDWFKSKIVRNQQNHAFPKPNFLLIHNENQKYRLLSSSSPLQTKLFDQVIAIGSGRGTFIELIKKIDTMPENHIYHPSSKTIDERNPFAKILSIVTYLVGEYLKEDFFLAKKSLGNLFGGFYEISVWYGGCFRKVVGQKILIWLYINNQLHFKTALIPEYDKKNLFIQTFEFENNKCVRKEKYQVPSIKMALSKENDSIIQQVKLPLLYNLVFRLKKDKRLIGIETVQFIANDTDHMFQIKDLGEQVAVMRNPELISQIMQQINESIKKVQEREISDK